MSRLTAVDLIAAERARQLAPEKAGGEGYDADHDRGHADELARAASVYALPANNRDVEIPAANVSLQEFLWPWDPWFYRPVPDDRVRELVKAGALIAAAIDALIAEQG